MTNYELAQVICDKCRGNTKCNRATPCCMAEIVAEGILTDYNVLKKKPYIKLPRCSCGSRKIAMQYHQKPVRYSMKCMDCGKETPKCLYKTSAKQFWNDMIDQGKNKKEK